MKKVISFVLCVIMLISCMSILCVAEESSNELANIATNGLAYCSSMKHSGWTPPNTINDGKANDWPGWEPKYPTIEPGENTSLGFSGEYCGIKFLNKEYYEIHSINITAGMHALYRQNTVYEIKALIEGEWITIKTFKDDQMKPDSYENYEDAMANDKSNYHIRSSITLTLDAPVTTNNIRIYVSEFGKNYPGGDVLIFPYIYEVELIGKLGQTPDIILPEGAEFTQNAALNALPSASSSARLFYPLRAIDKDEKTGWRPGETTAGQTLTLEFDKEYSIDKLTADFGGASAVKTMDYKFKIEALVGGVWQKVAEGTMYDDENKTFLNEFTLAEAVKTKSIRFVYEDAITRPPTLYELGANIVAGDRTLFNPTRFTDHQRSSSAKGNLAILGTAYASANFAPYSDPSFINDGKAFATSDVWYGGTLQIPVHCGIKLDRAYTVNKIAVYIAEPRVIGDDVTRFNIIAKVDGQDKIIASGRAYDPTKIVESSHTRYTTVYDFPEGVVTDDIRIEFTRGDMTIPNVMELEIYSNTEKTSMFDGYPIAEGDAPPVYTDVVPTPPSTEPQGPQDPTGGDEDDFNWTGLIVGIALCFVVAVATPITVILVKKSKSTVGGEGIDTDADGENNETENN